MEKDLVKSFVRQMRREIGEFNFYLGKIEKLIEDDNYHDFGFSSNRAELDWEAKGLKETRKYFNKAFRGLLESITDENEN